MTTRENVLFHVHDLFSEQMQLCGCGRPEAAYELVRDLLALAPFWENPEEVQQRIGEPGAYHIVLCTMERADLIEHGGSLGGSWLTPKGEWYLKALQSIDDWENIQYPKYDSPDAHEGDCTSACWTREVPS